MQLPYNKLAIKDNLSSTHNPRQECRANASPVKILIRTDNGRNDLLVRPTRIESAQPGTNLALGSGAAQIFLVPPLDEVCPILIAGQDVLRNL